MNGKEEVLDLVNEVCKRNVPLVARNLNLLLVQVSPLMEDNKTKLKMKTLDTLLTISL